MCKSALEEEKAVSSFGFFYDYHNHPFGDDLFTEFSEIGTPPPPPSTDGFLLLDDGSFYLLETGEDFYLL